VKYLSILVVASALFSAPLSAAPVTGTKPDALAVEAMHNFGACVVKMTPPGAREVLEMDYRTDAYNKKLRRLAKGHDRCTRPGTELRFNGVLFAGAMAEALIEDQRIDLAGASKLVQKIAARTPLESAALCTVLASPEAVGALLATEVASEKEVQATSALSPTLSACLSDNERAELSRSALRSVLALAAWRVSNHVPRQSEGGAQ
jgi:hypothetical protein